MPFKNPNEEAAYRKQYRREKLADGKRAKEPETLEAAIIELRALRAMVQKQRKRIWFLENKEKHNTQQRRRRRGGFEQNVLATLAAMQKRGEITIKNHEHP